MKKSIFLCFYAFMLLCFYASPALAADDPSGGGGGTMPDSTGGITNPVIGIFGTQPGNLTIAAILAAFLRLSLVAGGILLIFHLAWAGLNWLTAGADENKLRQSKDRINNALTGIFLLALVLVFIALINQILGLNILQPTLPTP